MVVQHNLTAMNSNRMLGITTGTQAKSTEKLSSGYKINRAADDAAGLSISEKMRKQIRGLSQASLNAEDGISAVQTAEGALNEVQDMLQRMNELAVKASNGTMSEDDRSYIQNEIEQLTTEIDRVAETTKFNETYLLKGDAGNKTVTLEAHDAGIKGSLVNNGDGTATFTMDALEVGKSVSIGGKTYTIANSDADVKALITENDGANGAKADVEIDGTTYKYQEAAGAGTGAAANDHAAGWYAVGANDAVDYTATFTAAQLGEKVTKGGEVKIGSDEYKVMKDTVTAGVDDTDSTVISKDKAYEFAAAELLKANQIGDTKNTAKVENADATEAEAAVFTQPDGTAVDDTFAAGFGVMAGDTVKGTVVLDLSGWTTSDTITIAGTTVAYAATGMDEIGEVVDALNADNGAGKFGELYTASIGTGANAGKIVVEQKTAAAKTADEMKALVTAATVGGTNVAANAVGTAGTVPVYDAFDNVAEMEAALADGKAIKKGNAGTAAVANTDYKYTAAVPASAGTANGTFKITLGTSEVANTLSFNLHVGADADMTNKIQVDIEAMTAEYLGVAGLDVTDTTGMDATYAVDAIQDAIQKISTQRSALGAIQNRLDHTIANLDNVVENTTAAESQIRDTDMATEMVKYSNNNILAQAGQAMLAQANQSNQGILSLLG